MLIIKSLTDYLLFCYNFLWPCGDFRSSRSLGFLSQQTPGHFSRSHHGGEGGGGSLEALLVHVHVFVVWKRQGAGVWMKELRWA